MAKATKNILSLKHDEALDFFMQSEQYKVAEMPEYFDFDKVLDFARQTIGDKPYDECLREGQSPEQMCDVNIEIPRNKDGRYAIRPTTLANPFLYYFLARELCSEKGWEETTALFASFSVPHITSCSIPVIPSKKEQFHRATTILNWWNSMEQRSIELSLEYQYMFVTDITNCYGSINTQAFEWAFDLKGTSLERHSGSAMASNIRRLIGAFQQGLNIGIPQSGALFDFVAEIILGYSDLLLHEAIKKSGIEDGYEILRFRDDYRIFCNDKETMTKISYILQGVLDCLNFRMNSDKTNMSESVVTDSIKPDKLAYIYNTPIFNKKGVDFDSFEKHLLYILMFSRQYPDSGSVKTMLADIDKRMEEHLKPYEEKTTSTFEIGEDGKVYVKDAEPRMRRRKLTGGSVLALSAVCTQIAMENAGCSLYAIKVLSRIVDSIDDEEEKWSIMDRVCTKLCDRPNSSYDQLWLQNMTFKRDKSRGKSPYTLNLCRLVAREEGVRLWNCDWMREDLVEGMPCSSVVDREMLHDMTPIIKIHKKLAYDEEPDFEDPDWSELAKRRDGDFEDPKELRHFEKHLNWNLEEERKKWEKKLGKKLGKKSEKMSEKKSGEKSEKKMEKKVQKKSGKKKGEQSDPSAKSI